MRHVVDAHVGARSAVCGLYRVIVGAFPIRYDSDIRAGAEVLDGIEHRGDLVEELEDFGGIVPVAAEVVVPVGAAFADCLGQIARQHRDAVLRRFAMCVAILRCQMRTAVRLEDADFVVEAIGGPQASCKHGAADLAVEFGVAAWGDLEIHVWGADKIVVYKMPAFRRVAHAEEIAAVVSDQGAAFASLLRRLVHCEEGRAERPLDAMDEINAPGMLHGIAQEAVDILQTDFCRRRGGILKSDIGLFPCFAKLLHVIVVFFAEIGAEKLCHGRADVGH